MAQLAILDIDGTLVDTNYQHAVAWYRAFRQSEVILPVWRIHRHIGMGGDQVVPALTDEETAEEKGDDIRAAEKALYLAMIEEVEPPDDWTTSADVEQTKPEPDLVKAALDKAGAEPGDAAMLGDTPWDCEAARRAGVDTVALMTGGVPGQGPTQAR